MATRAGPQLAAPVPYCVLYQSTSSRFTLREGTGLTNTYTVRRALPRPTVATVCPGPVARNVHVSGTRCRIRGNVPKDTGPGDRFTMSPVLSDT